MSNRRDGSYIRSQRLMEVAKKIAYDISFNPDKTCHKDDLVNWIMFEMGLTEKRAREYVEIVIKAKGWLVNNGGICSR